MSDYYAALSALSAALNGPINDMAARINVPVVSALLLGLIGAVAPCQLTTNVSALAFVSRRLDSGDTVWRAALAYTAGKVLVYAVVGAGIVLLGWQLSAGAVPVVVLVRKLLGPLLLLFGFFMLGVVRLNFTVGQRLSWWLEQRAGRGGWLGAFLLGVAFAFAFCPTLFLLFFGLLIPLSLSAKGGVLFPALFAFGTTLPLLSLAFVMSLAADSIGGYVERVKRVERRVRPAIAAVFLLAGLNDTLVYWFV